MPKSTKKDAGKHRKLYNLHPWVYRVHSGRADIAAHVEGHDWQTILTAHSLPGASAEAVAQFVCDLVNEYQQHEPILTDALKALLQHEKVYGFVFEGKRHDAGDKLGFLKATVEYALQREDLGPLFKQYLLELDIEKAAAGAAGKAKQEA